MTERRSDPLRRRNQVVAVGFLSPWALGFVLFVLGPMVLSFGVSFTDYPILRPSETQFVGLENYRTAWHDQMLARAVGVTLLYTVLAVPADLVVGMVLALILNMKARGVSVFRTVFFLPIMIGGTGGTSVAVALLWAFVFQPRFGLLNAILGVFNLPPQLWVASTSQVVPSLALMSLWGVGRSMLVYLAGLQGLSREVLLAASVDGASSWRRFWRIVLPLLTPMILFNLILDVVGALQTFTQAYVITQGGPQNASRFYLIYLYENAFTFLKMGYASTLAWLLFAFTLVVTAVIFKSSRRWVFYASVPPER